MADFYTLIESHEGEHVQLEVWGGRTRVRPGYHVGDLIELYSDDERVDARLHCRALNHDLSADLWLWLRFGQTTHDQRGTWVNLAGSLAEFVPEGERCSATVHADMLTRAFDEPPPADHFAALPVGVEAPAPIKPEVAQAMASEYQELMAHMDSGGDYFEFMAKRQHTRGVQVGSPQQSQGGNSDGRQ